MATLKQGGELATGDPVFCLNCEAAFNMYSKIEEKKLEGFDSKQIWVCEFCNAINEVNLDEEEIPKTREVNYILEAAAQIQDKKKIGGFLESTVIFVIDISGSMCVSK